MPSYNVFAGEATHYLPSGPRRFSPRGRIHEYALANPTTRLSGGGFSARIFVGLNVGARKAWKESDVVNVVWRVRKRQGKAGDASILSQKGIYESRSGSRVVEPSVQVIIIDLSGETKKAFTDEMVDLSEVLRKKLKQETVILEIQRRGVTTDVYSIT